MPGMKVVSGHDDLTDDDLLMLREVSCVSSYLLCTNTAVTRDF